MVGLWMLIAGYLTLLETDPHGQGDEGLGILKMLNWFVENLLFDNGRAGGMPPQHDGDVVIKKRHPDASARLPTGGARGPAVNADQSIVVAEQLAVRRLQRARHPPPYLDLHFMSDE